MDRASKMIDLPWAHERKLFGKGIGVAIIDTGISLHPDFIEKTCRVIAFKDFINGRTDPYDDNGHGTHVAGIIGGSGKASNGQFIGVAPECDIISVKVLNNKGNGNIADVLSGLNWILKHREKYHIQIVNISVGSTTKKDFDENSLLVQGVNEVWNNGMVVLAAAGNNGPLPQSIGAPGISRRIITVGASDDNVAVDISGNKAKDYSGRGPTKSCIKKPDIVAPGSNIMSCNGQRGNRNFQSGVLFPGKRGRSDAFYVTKSGTSMATPMVAGGVALLLSKYSAMNNREVKIRLKNSAVDLGYSHERQGWGMLNIKNMLE